MTKKASYGEQFYGCLITNLKKLEEQLDSKDGKLIRTNRNTGLFAKALHQAFGDMNDLVGLLVMTASCDFAEEW